MKCYSNPVLVQWVDSAGGRVKAAESLGVKYARLDHAYTGRRRVSPAMASTIELATGGQITRAALRPDLFGPLPPKRRKVA